MKTQAHGLRAMVPWFLFLGFIWLLNIGISDFLGAYFMQIVMYAGINIILAVSLNLVNGFTGQFSMGHAGFMSVGGYVSAFLTITLSAKYPELMEGPYANWVILPCIFIGGLGASAAGYLVGLPSLRLKGDYLAIVTLGFGEIIRVSVLNIDAIGGARGLTSIPQMASFGWVYTWVVVTLFVIWRLVGSAQGRGFKSVREDEVAAEAMGVNTTQAKVRAFVIGAFFAGAAGAIFAHYLRYLNPQTFDFNRSFEIIIMVVLGGMGSVTGSVIAAIFLTTLREALRPIQQLTGVDLRMVIYSFLLIVLMLTRPNGILGTKELTSFLPSKLKKRFGIEEAQT